jgi:hypothetical protein
MVQNPALATVSSEQLNQILGVDIAVADIAKIQAQIQLLTIVPDTSFWQSDRSLPGIYIILAGKVRLFDREGEQVATLTEGHSFGESTLFVDADSSYYTAKAVLLVGGTEISIGFIPRTEILSWWGRYPQIQSHLSQRAQHLEAILDRKIEPSALQMRQRGIQAQPSTVNPVRDNLVTAAAATPPAPATAKKTNAAADKLKEAYFPTPRVRMGQWWKQVTHNYPFYAQHSSSDCGAACLVMIGRYWDKEFNINRLRELANVGRNGASLKGLTNAAESLGFNSRPVKASLDRLANQRLPIIAHWEVYHCWRSGSWTTEDDPCRVFARMDGLLSAARTHFIIKESRG